MTYGYPPPPRDWRAQGPDDEEPGRSRYPSEPPTGSRPRIPQPPPPAKHVPPAPGQPSSVPYSAPPRSPQPYSAPPRSPEPTGTTYGGSYGSPAQPPSYQSPSHQSPSHQGPSSYQSPSHQSPSHQGPSSYPGQGYQGQGYQSQPAAPSAYQAPSRPTSPPPGLRRPPPNNQPGQPKGYPNFPPPVPTSPRIPPQAPRTGAVPTPAAPPRTGSIPTPATGPRTGPVKPTGGARNFAPPAAPNRAPAGKPGTRSPARPALPPLKTPRAVSFKDVPGLIKQLPQHKPWMIALGAIAVAVVVGVCGLGSFLLVKDDSAVVTAPTPQSTVIKRDITSREKDPNPMTAADVFPSADIVADPSYPPYKQQGEIQVAEDCRVGANGEVGKLLVAVGCNQVVRGVFGSPDGGYLVTAGIFNLPDDASATKASSDIEGLVNGGQGRFTGYISDVNQNLVMGRAPTNLAWEVRGHFIVYTVVARTDGAEINAEDAGVKLVVYDILRKYLRDKIIVEWSIQKTPPSGGASPAA